MAKIRFHNDGDRTPAFVRAERPLCEAIDLLHLEKRRHLGSDEKKVWFRSAGYKPNDKLNGYRSSVAVTVEIDETEAKASGWPVGFYFSSATPEAAIKKLRL